MTAGGGNFIEFFLMRNKRSAQWAVAPIEHADHWFESSTDHTKARITLAVILVFVLPVMNPEPVASRCETSMGESRR